jgi:hypothetical protein
LLPDGSLNGAPGDEDELPGDEGSDWHDWFGGPVPLGLPDASAPVGANTTIATDAAAAAISLLM